MIKSTLGAIAALSLLASPAAVLAQDSEDGEETILANRTFSKINYDKTEDRENVWLLDLSSGERVTIRLMPEWAPSHVERIKTYHIDPMLWESSGSSPWG